MADIDRTTKAQQLFYGARVFGKKQGTLISLLAVVTIVYLEEFEGTMVKVHVVPKVGVAFDGQPEALGKIEALCKAASGNVFTGKVSLSEAILSVGGYLNEAEDMLRKIFTTKMPGFVAEDDVENSVKKKPEEDLLLEFVKDPSSFDPKAPWAG